MGLGLERPGEGSKGETAGSGERRRTEAGEWRRCAAR